MTWAEVKAEAERLGIPHKGATAFYHHRGRAIRTGVGFEFTMADWWTWWQEDNRWERRGCRANDLVMARLGDIGPYRRDNVECITCSQNSRDGVRVRLRNREAAIARAPSARTTSRRAASASRGPRLP